MTDEWLTCEGQSTATESAVSLPCEQPARRIQDEHDELRLRDREAVRSGRFRQPSDDGIEILDVVDRRAIRVSETIVHRPTIRVQLRVRDDLARVTPMRAVDLAQETREPDLLPSCG